MSIGFPKRVVCLTEETTEALYAIDADELIVGISGFTVRPPHARKQKPKVSTYLDAKFEEIIALRPDVVFAWSDLQADISAELIRRGVEVVCFNHRSVDGILSMILKLTAIVGRGSAGHSYALSLQERVSMMADRGARRERRPRVYFEEWYDPIITGICWVSEIIEICGGMDVYAENRIHADAKSRIVADMLDPVRRDPDIMIASWCGKMLKPERVMARDGWDAMRPLRSGFLREIPSPVILQPGPAALTDGIDTMMSILDEWESSGRP